MIPRLSGGWQTTMADLALILFIVSAAGLCAHDSRIEAELPATGEPLAIFSAGEGAVPLAQWLAEQAPDHRQQLTVIVRYEAGQMASATDKALNMAKQAGEAGQRARIILEVGSPAEAMAVLAYDMPADAMAQTLQRDRQD